jgi:hypothetical protein
MTKEDITLFIVTSVRIQKLKNSYFPRICNLEAKTIAGSPYYIISTPNSRITKASRGK